MSGVICFLDNKLPRASSPPGQYLFCLWMRSARAFGLRLWSREWPCFRLLTKFFWNKTGIFGSFAMVGGDKVVVELVEGYDEEGEGGNLDQPVGGQGEGGVVEQPVGEPPKHRRCSDVSQLLVKIRLAGRLLATS